MHTQVVGPVLGIALRTAVRGPMCEVDEAVAQPDAGLEGDVTPSPKRGITFLARSQWNTVQRELGTELPWHTRRANVLVDADSLHSLIGRVIRVGQVEVQINAETRPCELMDELHMGLKDALKPDCRAGVYGQVLKGGRIRLGDVMRVVVANDATDGELAAEQNRA